MIKSSVYLYNTASNFSFALVSIESGLATVFDVVFLNQCNHHYLVFYNVQNQWNGWK